MAHKTKIDKIREKTGEAKPSTAAALSFPVGTDTGRIDHYQAAMDANLASLKQLKTLQEKQAAKREMLATYEPFVSAYVRNGDNYPNDVAVNVCVWLADTGDMEAFVPLALLLIAQKQRLPKTFDRDLATFACDSVYDWASELLKKQTSASPVLDQFVDAVANNQWDLHPAVKGKMFAMLAKHKFREADYLACFNLCLQAEAANPESAGVKTMKTQAEALAKKAPQDLAGNTQTE